MPESGLGGCFVGFFFKWTNKQNAYPLTEFLLCFSSSNLGHTSVNSQKTWQSYAGSLKGSFCMLREWYCTCHKSRLRHKLLLCHSSVWSRYGCMSIEVNGSAAISWTLSGWGLRLVAMLTELLIRKQSCITVAWNGKTGTNNFAFLTKKDFEVFLLFFWVF